MKGKQLSLEQKKLDQDLWTIVFVTSVVFLIDSMYDKQLMEVIKDSNRPILLRLLINGGLQFGIAGLGITIVSILRKEKFQSYGLRRRGALSSIIGAVVSFLPYVLYILISGQFEGYHPLHIFIMDDILKSNIVLRVLGIAVIAVIWGFFEGFNYAVINDKLNERYPTKKKWLNVGAITCAIVCILFHPINLTLLGVMDCITSFIGIYGMLIMKNKTKNAWGCIFVFCFIWNAI